MSANTELIEVLRAQTLTASGTTYFSPQFPLGEGWVRMHLRFTHALTHGNGSSALSEGELNVIKGITLRTDKGEIICNNVPGRHLYRLGQIKTNAAATKTAIAAATASYYVPIDIWFSEPKRIHESEMHKTILNTARYGSLTLGITMGSASDLLGTVGTDTVAFTVDIYVERFKGLLPASLAPSLYVQYGVQAPQNPNNQTYIDLERSETLAYKRLMLYSTSSATAGVPMSGTMDDTVVNDFDVEQTEKFVAQNILNDVAQRIGMSDMGLAAIPAGISYVSFVDKSRSHMTCLATGGLSKLRYNWRNQGSLPSNPQVTVGYEAVRPLQGR